ncbi:MAG: hypothetical protein H7338_03575 [Candidatus Sericytochromatia bacterium]|nr:hypothetical protein [Candidatus Sericytochromatia bacterium]
MATTLQTTTPVSTAPAGVNAADLETRVKQIPNIFAGMSAEQLLSQVPALKAKADAHKAALDGTRYVEQLKGVTRAYRRLVAEMAGNDRMESTAVLPMLITLEGVLAAAETAGFSREGIVGKADSLTQKPIGAMAIAGLHV